jgi:hypothetical protein
MRAKNFLFGFVLAVVCMVIAGTCNDLAKGAPLVITQETPKIEVRGIGGDVGTNNPLDGGAILGMNGVLALPAPVLVSPANNSSVPEPSAGNGVPLTWNSVEGAVKYQLYGYLLVGSTWTQIANWTGTATTAGMYGLKEGYTIKWKVRGIDATCAYGDWSEEWIFILGPLPVKLISFLGAYSDGNVTLNWATLTEVSNYGFEVQRSTVSKTDGFATIGFVPGNGTSIVRHDYTYADVNPPTGTIYYRLRQVDLTGESEYSDVIAVLNGTLADVLLADTPTEFSLAQNYPNPFNPSTTIQYTLPNAASASLTVYNTLGERIVERVLGVQPAGVHATVLDMTGLPSGTYLYRLEAGSSVSTMRMVLVK